MDRLNLVDFVRSDKCFDKLNDAKGQLKIVIRCNKLINWRGGSCSVFGESNANENDNEIEKFDKYNIVRRTFGVSFQGNHPACYASLCLLLG